jgi:penicillin-binding protein 1A
MTASKQDKNSEEFSTKTQRRIILCMWTLALLPFLAVFIMLQQSKSSLPSTETLENPPELQASIVYADNGEELGRYWRINRKSVPYNQISQNVYSALIATEDKRYYEHAGVDAQGLARAVTGVLTGQSKGGGSTISQQLAKLLFTDVAASFWERFKQKFGENILATRLERNYTKEEIISMYLNRFDFLYNAVGISSAAHVYFNKKPSQLNIQEAAMLVGMCKNPSLYNPKRNYETALLRRNVVLNLWAQNSNNEGVTIKLSEQMCDSLKKLPITLDYQAVDHKLGLAPYFREVLRKDVSNLLEQKNEKGELIYHKKDGSAYNIYEDGLKIYTTINIRLQKYAEQAVEKHLSETLQKEFDKNNKRVKNFPFANRASDEEIENILNRAIKMSDRYKNGIKSGKSEETVRKEFNKKVEMTVFSWKGDIDTVLTPIDSIRYFKSFLQAGLLSIEPQTGFIKAWVGGIDFANFAYDHVKLGKRQVGSTIKPFVYSAAIRFGVVTPCMKFPNIPYCIDVPVSPTQMKSWCPNPGEKTTGELISVRKALALSLNNITVKVMDLMGATQGPQAVAQLMKDLGIEIRQEDIVPAMCLGVMDLSLYEMVGAQAAIANKGIYNKPMCILRIEDRNGNIIFEGVPESRESMNENLAYTTLNLMKGVTNGGTGGSLRSGRPWGGITYPMAGKTGTTQNNTDGWYMGLTPDLVTGIWVGADDRQVSFRSMEWGQGARMALPIFGYYMQKVYKDSQLNISKGDFEHPENYNNDLFNCGDLNDQNNEINKPPIHI